MLYTPFQSSVSSRVNRYTDLQTYVDKGIYPPAPLAYGLLVGGGSRVMEFNANKGNIEYYIKQNMNGYVANIYNDASGVGSFVNPKDAVKCFLEKNRKFASNELLEQYGLTPNFEIDIGALVFLESEEQIKKGIELLRSEHQKRYGQPGSK